MVATSSLNKFSYFVAIYLLVACWQTGSVNGAPSSSGVDPPYCNQILGDSSVNCDVEIQKGWSKFLGISCIINGLSREISADYGGAEACDIDFQHGLRIKLERITKISHILLQESAFVPRFTNVSLALGRASYMCKHSRDDRVKLSNQSFAKFSCVGMNIGVHGETPVANVIQVNSLISRTLSLATLRTKGLLGWVLVMDGTNGNFDTFGTDWNETKGTNTRPESESQENNWENPISKGCPPIMPYVGMPKRYENYQLVIDGSINDLLFKKPCREGYRFVGHISDIIQCRNGTWQGSRSPECEVIETKRPPNVDHAIWSYVYEDSYHEIRYFCEDGYYTTGNGIATYSTENDDWTGVPECRQWAEDPSLQVNPLIIYIAAGVIAIALAAVLLFICCIRKIRRQDCNNSRYEQVNEAM